MDNIVLLKQFLDIVNNRPLDRNDEVMISIYKDINALDYSFFNDIHLRISFYPLNLFLFLDFKDLKSHVVEIYHKGKPIGFVQGFKRSKLYDKDDPRQYTSKEYEFKIVVQNPSGYGYKEYEDVKEI